MLKLVGVWLDWHACPTCCDSCRDCGRVGLLPKDCFTAVLKSTNLRYRQPTNLLKKYESTTTIQIYCKSTSLLSYYVHLKSPVVSRFKNYKSVGNLRTSCKSTIYCESTNPLQIYHSTTKYESTVYLGNDFLHKNQETYISVPKLNLN